MEYKRNIFFSFLCLWKVKRCFDFVWFINCLVFYVIKNLEYRIGIFDVFCCVNLLLEFPYYLLLQLLIHIFEKNKLFNVRY